MAKIQPASRQSIAEAARILAADGIVAIPTETVYGLGARADSKRAVARIFKAKGRPAINPLIIHVNSLEMARAFAHFDKPALDLASAFWPGPLSLVLLRNPQARLAPAICAGLETIALRWPDAPIMNALIEDLEVPIAAPSANRSGKLSPSRAEHVARDLGTNVDLIIDDGPCVLGLESTIIHTKDAGIEVLRPGSIDTASLAKACGRPVIARAGGGKSGTRPDAPGQLAAHYAPQTPLIMNAKGEVELGFGAHQGVRNLSPSGDLTEAAHHLYFMLSELDQGGHEILRVAPIPDHGIGRAINDRLARAASANAPKKR